MMVTDLGNQVAEKAVQVAEWKTRALLAEHSLEEIAAKEDGAEDEEGEVAPVVALVPNEDEEDEPDAT